MSKFLFKNWDARPQANGEGAGKKHSNLLLISRNRRPISGRNASLGTWSLFGLDTFVWHIVGNPPLKAMQNPAPGSPGVSRILARDAITDVSQIRI